MKYKIDFSKIDFYENILNRTFRNSENKKAPYLYKRFFSEKIIFDVYKNGTLYFVKNENDEEKNFVLRTFGLEEFFITEDSCEYTFYVDGSYKNGVCSYAAVILHNEIRKEIFYGKLYNDKFLSSRNVYGEVVSSLVSLKWAKDRNLKKILIVYDYLGIEKWAKNLWKTEKELTALYVKLFSDFSENITVNFKHVKSHSGEDKFNDLADEYAKKAFYENDNNYSGFIPINYNL
ncbi:MAG: hypothetical protein H7A31_02235 [Thermotogae bacterium]|nr:hypothetical protein [Thermotogota bacterium]MCP5465496.1 hypothetical protein [Thermotogota bacterium]